MEHPFRIQLPPSSFRPNRPLAWLLVVFLHHPFQPPSPPFSPFPLSVACWQGFPACNFPCEFKTWNTGKVLSEPSLNSRSSLKPRSERRTIQTCTSKKTSMYLAKEKHSKDTGIRPPQTCIGPKVTLQVKRKWRGG